MLAEKTPPIKRTPTGRLSRVKEILHRHFGGFHTLSFICNESNSISRYEARLDCDDGPIVNIVVGAGYIQFYDPKHNRKVVEEVRV